MVGYLLIGLKVFFHLDFSLDRDSISALGSMSPYA